MKFSCALLLPALASFASASPLIRSSSSGVTSKLQMSRHLDEDMSWMSGYTIKYENCFHDSGLVTFRLCPAENNCKSGCSGGGQYLVDFYFFIDAFTEAQMNAHDYICEQVRENCDYDDEDTCYENAGLKYCMDKDDDDFNVQEYLECSQFGDDGYYVGPYCSSDDAYSIYLGLFTDEDCTVAADTGKFYDLYGYELPYSSSPIIDNECTKCKEHGKDEHQDYGDQEDEDDVLEQCEELYQEADKCEEDIDVENPDLSACSYIEALVEEEEVIQASYVSASNSSNGDWWHGTGPLWVALGITVLVVCALQICLLREVQKRDRKTGPENSASKESLI